MNKRVLIISPYFPPSNAADMQRVRMSLPYFKEFGWDAEVVTVDPEYSDMAKDELLLQSIPVDIKIHQVSALNKKLTSKFGLGSLALRSMWFYKRKVNRILRENKFDLVYFSTTQFPVCILGAYWKKKFNVPYVIDMQDPWHSDYYTDKLKNEQPPKFWFSYRLNKYLEPLAIKHAGGLIAVSDSYIIDLKKRYKEIENIPASTITFGVFSPDLEIAQNNETLFEDLLLPGYSNLVYLGRGGTDMHKAVSILFEAMQRGLHEAPQLFDKIKIYFIGTSYAPKGKGVQTIMPLAKQFGIENNVIELTDRISFYHMLITLQKAQTLFVPGSDDPKYTASKIYPYLLTRKPLITIFNKNSNVIDTITTSTENVVVITFPDEELTMKIELYKTLFNLSQGIFNPVKLLDNFENYNAKYLTYQQTKLFNQVIDA